MEGDRRYKRAELRRNRSVRVRVTRGEEEELVRRAERAGLTLSAYVRQRLLEGGES